MTATSKNQQPVAMQSKAIAKYENISEQVLNKIEKFQADGGLTLPANYSVENHMKSAWLILQSTKDRDGNPALSVCTKDSIANALFDMVLQGLAVSKNQGYFIVYGNKLEFQRSYFGTVALAKRVGGIKSLSRMLYMRETSLSIRLTRTPQEFKLSSTSRRLRISTTQKSRLHTL